MIDQGRRAWNRCLAVLLVVCSAGIVPAQSPDRADDPALSNAESFAQDSCFEEAVHRYGFFETIGKSMFGKQPDPDREWTPLTLRDFGEGWFEPWIAPPNPTGGSRRQGWINSNDAFFNRQIVGIYSYTDAVSSNRDEHTGTLLWETPITRRYMFGAFIPFVDSLQNGTVPERTGFGNVTLENRFILEETQDFTLSFNFNARIPTGPTALGDHRTSLNPYVAFFKDIGRGVSLRGIGGIDVPVDSRPDGINSTLIQQLGIGKTLTPHDVPPLGDLTPDMVFNVREFLGTNQTFLSLTPGFRTFLGRNFWLLGGVEVPLVGPRPFQERLTFAVVKGY
jgi:hypothetical protein